MMLRKFLPYILFLTSLLMPFCLWAASPLSGLDVTAAVREGNYRGLMDVTMSKGKTFKGYKAMFVLQGGKLRCDVPKIGKMPGKIRIDLPVKVNADGTLVAQPECGAGVMSMPMGFKVKLKLESLKGAKIEGHRLCFTLNVYGQFMGMKFPTSVYFTGTV